MLPLFTRLLGFPFLLAVVMIAMVLLTALLFRTRERRKRAKATFIDTLYFGTERVHGAHLRLVHEFNYGPGNQSAYQVTLHAVFPLQGDWEQVLLDADSMGPMGEGRAPTSKVTLSVGKRMYVLRAGVKSCQVVTHPGGARFAVVAWHPGDLTLAAT